MHLSCDVFILGFVKRETHFVTLRLCGKWKGASFVIFLPMVTGHDDSCGVLCTQAVSSWYTYSCESDHTPTLAVIILQLNKIKYVQQSSLYVMLLLVVLEFPYLQSNQNSLVFCCILPPHTIFGVFFLHLLFIEMACSQSHDKTGHETLGLFLLLQQHCLSIMQSYVLFIWQIVFNRTSCKHRKCK